MWILSVFLAVSVTLIPILYALNIMNEVSDATLGTVVGILEFAWVLIGLTGIIWTLWTLWNANSTFVARTPVQEGRIAKQWIVTGTADRANSSFTMVLHLSEMSPAMKLLHDIPMETLLQSSKEKLD
jgi:hypothetical protein